MTAYKKAREIFYLALVGEEIEVTADVRKSLRQVIYRSKIKKKFCSRTVNGKIIVWRELNEV
jgi:hypothetical protein